MVRRVCAGLHGQGAVRGEGVRGGRCARAARHPLRRLEQPHVPAGALRNNPKSLKPSPAPGTATCTCRCAPKYPKTLKPSPAPGTSTCTCRCAPKQP
eukprot:1194428-Prorocentrum_minimum.AAC.1